MSSVQRTSVEEEMVSAYWRIFADEVPGDLGIELTADQVEALAEAIEGAAENQSTACGWDMIPNPDRAEITRLEALLKKERQEAVDAESVWAEAMAFIGGVRQSQLYRDGKRIKVSA
jgi:hypothetical protein